MAWTRNQISKWASRHGITSNQAIRLRSLIERYAEEQTHEINGDLHPHNVFRKNDKNENARLWSEQSEQTASQLRTTAIKAGFDGVDFGAGLHAVLMKDSDYIMVPEFSF